MSRAPRMFAFALLAGLALVASGCKSNNEGKIVGKWKLSNPPEKQKGEFEQLAKMGLYMYIDFKADGNLVLGVESDNPAMMALLKQGAPGGKTSFSCKYKLQSGDKVEFYDIKDKELKEALHGDSKARSDIIINGDEMTIKDPDGTTTKLTRMKNEAPPAGPAPGAGGGAADKKGDVP